MSNIASAIAALSIGFEGKLVSKNLVSPVMEALVIERKMLDELLGSVSLSELLSKHHCSGPQLLSWGGFRSVLARWIPI